MDIPPPDPVKILAHWMEWEHGNVAPADLIKNLKVAGMLELLNGIVDALGAVSSAPDDAGAPAEPGAAV